MSVMPSNHLILCRPLLFPPSIFPSIRLLSNDSVLLIRWPKYWSFSFNISPSSEYSGLISFQDGLAGFPCSPRDSQESSPTPQFKSINSSILSSLKRLSDFTFTFHFHALEKEMATHSSILTWRIPGTEKPGGLLCIRSHGVRHEWSDLAAPEAEELEIKLPTSVGSLKKQENFRKSSTSALLTTTKPWTMQITANCG